jgi:mono/diheme cytochrome c family protein
MYAHGIRNFDVAHLNSVGVLKYASFVPQQYRTITEENKVKVGEYLFKLECRVCQSVNGVNAITKKVKSLDENAIYHRIGALNSPATPFMPPFVGTDEERRALAAYLATLVEQKQTQTAINK